MPQPFPGSLNQNEIYDRLYNMIISIQTESGNIKGLYSALVDAARVDGTLFGDTKIYIDTDVLETHAWGNDAEAPNLLNLDRSPKPKTQSIVLNKFRQIRCTVDDVLSRRAFYDEGAFASFTSVLLGWITDTKRVYDSRLYSTYIGTTKTSVGKQSINVDLTTATQSIAASDVEGKARVRAQHVAKAIADTIVLMKDASRDFNDYGFLRSYDEGEIKCVFNAKYANEITKLDLPTMFHQVGIDKFGQYILPDYYFGNISTSAIAAASNTGQYRSVIEKDYTVGGATTHCFPGDKIPAAVAIAANEGYEVDDKVICKMMTVLPPFLSAFSIGSSFWNPRSLTTNHYLTFGFNTLEYLKGKPFITFKEI